MKIKLSGILILAIMAAAGLGLAQAQEQTTPPPATPQQPSLTVEEAVMCLGVVDRVPQLAQALAAASAPATTTTPTETAQPSTPAAASTAATAPATFSPGKVYCFTKVSGTAPATIKHVWYFGDKAVHTMELAIDGSPWRTWSYKTVPPEMTGAWKVEIQDAAGTVLKTLDFTVQ